MRKPNRPGRTSLVPLASILALVVLGVLAWRLFDPGGVEPAPTTRLDRALERELEQMVALGYVQGSEPATPRAPSGVTGYEPNAAWTGLNLVVSAHAPEALLLDMEGRELHRWSRSFAETWPDRAWPKQGVRYHRYWRRVHPLSDGSLLAIFENLGLVKLDRDSNVVWTYQHATHHDLAEAPDGTLYVLIRAARRIPTINVFRPVLEDFVAILSPDGRELRRISLFEALKESDYADWLQIARDGDRDDIFHTNTVELLDGSQQHVLPAFREGNVLVSFHSLHAIAVVDLEREKVVWGLQGGWRFQHEPTLLDDGNLMLFDNTGIDKRSRVLEIDPRSGEVVWRYERTERPVFFSLCCGTNQRLPNGNTLITETQKGRAFEVDRGGRSVWEYRNPHRVGEDQQTLANLFEVLRLPSGFADGWVTPPHPAPVP